ncbi:hypothetical protein DFH94DRAFT_780292 [Russula ochroleuca]|uniref:Secreted protein n=1 Tax=Russula ochroleuca TaxID=152965 RepID=A0A9P5JW10_9AGAM|nr:hypothetical protein DFH94DRAFT_780292 [Russula ochroleuca]
MPNALRTRILTRLCIIPVCIHLLASHNPFCIYRTRSHLETVFTLSISIDHIWDDLPSTKYFVKLSRVDFDLLHISLTRGSVSFTLSPNTRYLP